MASPSNLFNQHFSLLIIIKMYSLHQIALKMMKLFLSTRCIKFNMKDVRKLRF